MRFGLGNRVKVKFPWMQGGDERGWAFSRGPRQTTALDGSRITSSQPKIVENKKGLSMDFVTSATDPRGVVSTATYDDHGDLLHTETTERKSGAVVAADFTYDRRGRLTSITHPADGGGCRRVDGFEFYEDPSLAGFGFLKKATVDKGGGLFGDTSHFRITASFEYDAVGNVVRCVDPRGNDTRMVYNALDQRISMNVTVPKQTQGATFGEKVTRSFTYAANDNLVQVDHENRDQTGALDPINPLWTSSSEFDVMNRARLVAHELTHVVQQGGGGVHQRSMTNRFSYDGNGNLVLEELPESVNGNDPDNVVSFQYDERDLPFRVLAAPGTSLAATEQFDYNRNGQRARVSKVDAFSIKQTIFSHDGFGRCVKITDAMGNIDKRTYDANDNLLSSRFDGEINDVDGSANNRHLSETRYEYDSLDRCVRRRVSFFDIFTELSLTDGESTHSTVYAPNGSFLSETDDLGNTLALTDQVGKVLERYDYNDYGSPRFLDSKGAPILVDGQPASASPLGNPFLFHGMFWDAETALYRDSGMGGENPMYEPKTGRYLMRGHRDVGGYRASFGANDFTFAGDNPWTGNSPGKMKRGTVKFFNETKGFGMMADGGGGGTTRAGISTSRSNIRHGHSVMGGEDTIEVMFNPKEYSISKVTVRGWDWKQKKEEGGRHTPFHNKRTTDVTGEIELEAGRVMGAVNSNPLYEESNMSGSNPLYSDRARWLQPGQPVYGNRSGRFSSVSNVLKTKHDTAKNSVGNIR